MSVKEVKSKMLLQSPKIMVTAISEGVGEISHKAYHSILLMEVGQRNSWSLSMGKGVDIPDGIEEMVPYSMVCEVDMMVNRYGLMITAKRPPVFSKPGGNGHNPSSG